MAYTKNTWADGDVVTSEKLNHMEDGIASGESVFIVGGATIDAHYQLEGTLDKTWQEIHDALQNKICIVVATDNVGIMQYDIKYANMLEGDYAVLASADGTTFEFRTSTASGYPSTSGGN